MRIACPGAATVITRRYNCGGGESSESFRFPANGFWVDIPTFTSTWALLNGLESRLHIDHWSLDLGLRSLSRSSPNNGLFPKATSLCILTLCLGGTSGRWAGHHNTQFPYHSRFGIRSPISFFLLRLSMNIGMLSAQVGLRLTWF